ncbi:MAG: hypothetical protein EBW87_04185 [Burkholderiaceae bacterium]|jgi:hypothetical protein|nr:hypothetical protein [Burkholderiaceae bacterium]
MLLKCPEFLDRIVSEMKNTNDTNEIETDEVRERHERNMRALGYLDRCRAKQEEEDHLSGTPLQRVSGCLGIVGFCIIFWYCVLAIIKALIES